MESTALPAPAEMTEATFLVYTPGKGTKRKTIRAASRVALDVKVAKWQLTLDDDEVVTWPADYNPFEEV